MTATVTIDRPPVAKPVPRRRSAKPATVSASALAQHLDCTRTYIRKLEGEGVLHRAPDGGGFDVDASRVAYLRFLRREHRHTPRSKADAAHIEVKTQMLQLRLMEKKKELVLQSDVDELIDNICGTMLTHLSSLPAQCAPLGDLATRRRLERWVFDVRTAMSEAATREADKAGEPALNQQG